MGDFKMTIDKFMKVMWSNNDFWLQVQKEQGLFDLEFVSKTANKVHTKSKVAMITNETLGKLIPFIPAHCDQETETTITKDACGNYTVVDVINSSNFPYAEAITIERTYHVSKTSRGINVKVEGDMKYNNFIVDQIKPSIEADVHLVLVVCFPSFYTSFSFF